MKNKLNIITSLVFMFAVFGVITAFVFEGSSTGSFNAGKAFTGGAVEIHAGANLTGCVNGPGGPFPFTTNAQGIGYVTGLSAGNYSICVENWGATTFRSDGGSEIMVTVPNNVDCTC